MSGDTYERWFSRTRLLEADEDSLTLEVPNNIYQVWIETNYMDTLQGAIKEVLNAGHRIRFEFSEEEGAEAIPDLPDVSENEVASAALATRESAALESRELKLAEPELVETPVAEIFGWNACGERAEGRQTGEGCQSRESR